CCQFQSNIILMIIYFNLMFISCSLLFALIEPDVVQNLTVVDVTTSSVKLNWIKPVGESSYYRVKYENFSMTINKTTDNTTISITNRTPGVQYTFRVSAVAADNITEGQSVGLSVYTKPDVIQNLIVVDVTTSSVKLNWIKPVGESSYYRVQYGNFSMTLNKTTDNTTISISNRTPGVQHSFRVSAVAADNITEGQSVFISVYTKPDVIQNLIVVDVTTSSVKLNWIKPVGESSYYRVQYGNFSMTLNKTTDNTTISISNRTPGVQYSFRVSAVAADNITEGQSVFISVYTKPDVIQNLTVVDVTTSSVTLNWIKPVGESSYYRVQYDKFSMTLNKTTENTVISITNRTPGVQYTFRVSAVAADNSTEGQSVGLSVYTKPDIIRNLGASNISNSSVSLTWTGPVGESSLFRVLQMNGTESWNKTIKETQFSFPDLTPGSRYNFTVSAIAADNVTEGKGVDRSICTKNHCTSFKAAELLFGFLIVVLFTVFYPLSCSNISVRIEEYEAYFRKQQADSNCGFAEEYEDLKIVGTAQAKSSALAIENKGKNRYNNVLPYKGFIKECLCVQGYNSKKEYIAAQGPLPATVNEFWRMIWEKHVHTIVMLTRCNEQGRVKCEKYWPSQSKMYNNLGVTNTSEIPLEDWTISDFTIKNVKTAETRQVRHFHFTAWPDHGVPETTEVLINFRHLVREHMDQYSRNSPTVVHCSAGVGRTGTFIALDHLIFQIERDSMVDIFGIVYDMRMHRTLMVQTEDQYVFLNQCAVDIIKSRMGTNVDLIYQNAAAFSVYGNL
uniref:protein-tyrosine-phosphatase n=1 Tax=Astyanax mexicanus TaxID=7994 RepID=A0A8B9HNS7_ASTMX